MAKASLAGKVVIITGASSGIGEACGILFAAEGAKVVLCARRKEKLDSIAQKIKSEHPAAVVDTVSLDVRDAAAFKKAVDDVNAVHGRVDILINNAGVMLLSMMKNLQLAEWNDMVAININGVMNGVAAVLPIMRAQKFGHIVNMSSDADRKVFPGSAIYSGTKAFVSMMSEGLRMELCQDGIPVHVTSLSAGAVATELGSHIKDAQVIDGFSKGPQMEFMQPQDVAEIMLFVVTRAGRVNINNVLFRPVEQSS